MPAEAGLDLAALLREEELEHLGPALADQAGLRELQDLLAANRPFFLTRLKELGVARLGERQKLANALSKAEKAGRLAASVPVPHLRPATYRETGDDLVVIRLLLPPGAKSNQLAVAIDANSIDVRLLGQATSLVGTLGGLVRAADCLWELERAPAVEEDPLLPAAAQPAAPPDVLVVTLTKARPAAWTALLKGGGVALREAEPEKPPPPAEKRRPIELNSTPAPGFGVGFRPRKFNPARGERPDHCV